MTNNAKKLSPLKNWWIFTQERFHPVSHFTMLFVFVLFHLLMSTPSKRLDEIPLFNGLFLYLGVVVFYYKLRLYDEIKDYELDCVINPHRPLPRGLLFHRDLYLGIVLCLIFEQIFFSRFGQNAVFLLVIAQVYSLIMYKEFFIRDIIRPHLTTYAVLHTVVTSFLTFAILGALKDQNILEAYIDRDNILMALNNWLLFNVFEFGRKTYATEEERAGVDTYSSLFTPYGAFLLQLIQTGLSSFCIFTLFYHSEMTLLRKDFLIIGLLFIQIIFMLISALYLSTNLVRWAKIYRSFSEIYIVLVFLFMLALIIFT
ncbi:MAG: hypothetical protein L6Q33_15100 [Bacteriovoracaceae bacterium]|nr:hypothetical protein [Bacteriovoracaceae bacterium]